MLAGATVGDGVGEAVGLGLAATVGTLVALGDGVGAGRVVHATTANANTRTPSRRTPLVCQVREPGVSYRPRTVTATRPSDSAEASNATPQPRSVVIRPFAASPMTPRSAASRRMKTRTIGRSRPFTFCEIRMSG